VGSRSGIRVRLALALVLASGGAACAGDDGGGDGDGSPVVGGPSSSSSSSEERDAGEGTAFPAAATKNTTRVPGADHVATAANVALAVYPSTTAQTRPGAVVLVERSDWRAAISAAQLAADPISAPLLFADGSELPETSAAALERLAPTGAKAADNVQLIRVATPARPADLRDTNLEGATAPAVAKAIDAFAAAAAGRFSDDVIVAGADAPEHAMPAAAWAAKSGDPVLWTGRDVLPPETREAIAAHGRPRIFVMGPESAVSDRVLDRLERLGSEVRRIGAVADVAAASVAFARFSVGTFGWNVVDPGHGLVIAAAERPADAGASASLSTSGTYGPLLVLPDAGTLAPAIREYLLDIQPGYDEDPVRGVYNHAWLVGDEAAVSVDVQSSIDALLEIAPVDQTP
jgi:putative cell wall-binding protein